jgi:hypothetical protein
VNAGSVKENNTDNVNTTSREEEKAAARLRRQMEIYIVNNNEI